MDAVAKGTSEASIGRHGIAESGSGLEILPFSAHGKTTPLGFIQHTKRQEGSQPDHLQCPSTLCYGEQDVEKR